MTSEALKTVFEPEESIPAPLSEKFAKIKIEYGIFDLGEDLNPKKKSLYINRTWETEYEANLNRRSLLKGYPFDNPWISRLVVGPHKKISPAKRKREQELPNDSQTLPNDE